MSARRGFRLSLVTRLSALVGTLLALGIIIALALDHFIPGEPWLVFAICVACVVPISIITLRSQVQPILSLFRALEGTVTSYKDGDFSFSLHWPYKDELADLIYQYGEDRDSRRIARAIIAARPLRTTRQLADVIDKVHRGPREKIHPATRTFQALRIAVNGELEILE